MPTPQLPAKQSWVARAWSRLWAWTRAKEAPVVVEHNHGADFHANHRQGPSYSPRRGLSAMAAFPWVYAAMIRRASDIAGLPLEVGRGRGKKFTALEDHPLYDLLERPHTRSTGRQWRKQMELDYRLTGNHLSAILGFGGPVTLLSLQRLHPERVKIEPDPVHGWGDYLFESGDEPITYPARQVLHLRGPSWADDPRGLWGTGAIQCLDEDLTADKRARHRAAEMTKYGRPDVILSPDSEEGEVVWDPAAREEISKTLNAMLLNLAGGSLVLSNSARVLTPSWSPRDMEFPALRGLAREAVLAVTGVPPHLVGLPVANYAQAEAQERAYWEMLQAEAKDIEDAIFNPLARLFGPRLRVRHDFGEVDVLQEGRTKRLERVVKLVNELGRDVDASFVSEGFAPLPAAVQQPVQPPASLPEEQPAGRPGDEDLDDGQGSGADEGASGPGTGAEGNDNDEGGRGAVLTFADFWQAGPAADDGDDDGNAIPAA